MVEFENNNCSESDEISNSSDEAGISPINNSNIFKKSKTGISTGGFSKIKNLFARN